MMAGLMVVVIFVVGGGAVDFIRLTTARADLQAATDSAVLAAASLSNQRSPIEVANDYFDNNFDGARFDLENVVFTPVIDSNKNFLREISATANADMPTYFIGLLDVINRTGSGGLKSFSINVSAKAAESEQLLEIALVLDVSGSMDGPKINSLRSAGEAFINKIYSESSTGQASVSIIPFAANVNIEPLFDSFADTTGIALPAARTCALYDAGDFNSSAFANLLTPVDQTSTDKRAQCTKASAIFNSDNQVDLVNALQSLKSGGRTDAHIGLMWGAKALSPDNRGTLGGDFLNRPRNYSRRTIKALVVMTDGIMNPIPDPAIADTVAEATAQFSALCDEAKTNNIIVYSIGFDITAGDAADVMLRDCASNLSQYFFVEGLDISTAFDGIATSILALRITD